MSAYPGSKVTLRIGDGGVPTESFAVIGGLQMTRFRLSQETVASTAVRSSGWEPQLVAGARSLEVSGRGVYTDSAAEQSLQAAALSGAVLNYELQLGNGDVISGTFIVTLYERDGEIGDVESFEVTLKSAANVSVALA